MNEYSRHEWCRFATENGGIGSCRAAITCAGNKQAEHLAFRKGDQVTILCCLVQPGDSMYPQGWYLGFCGYMVGYFDGAHMESVPPLLGVGTLDRSMSPNERPFAKPVPLQSCTLSPNEFLVLYDPISRRETKRENAPPVHHALLFQSLSPPSLPKSGEYDDVYSIYDTYFRPSTFVEPDVTNGTQEKEKDEPLTPERPIDKVLNVVSEQVPNRLLQQDDSTGGSNSLQDSPSFSSTESSFYAAAMTSPATQVRAQPKTEPIPTTPSKQSARVYASATGSPYHMARSRSQQAMASSPRLPRHGGAYSATPPTSPYRVAPTITSPASMAGSGLGSGTSRESPSAGPAPSLYGSPRSKMTLDVSEHALSDRAQLFQLWTTLLTDRSPTSRTLKKAQQLVHLGVPSALRGRVWLLLADKQVQPKRGVFDQMCQASSESQRQPDKYQFSILIEQDLHQCFPVSQPFDGMGGSTRDTIRRILHAYAFYNPKVGYTEGMCLLVGLLLTHLHAEDAFWLLDAIVHGYGMEHIYTGDMHRLHVDNLVVDELLRMVDVELHQQLRDLSIEPIMFLPGWILPIFVRTLPWATLVRVWDMFMCYGYTFLLRTAVAILCLCRQTLLQLPHEQRRMMTLRHLVFVPPGALSEVNVLNRALELPVTNKEIVRMEATAERLLQERVPSDATLEQEEGVRRAPSMQGKPMTKKTLRVLLGRKN